MTWGIAGSRTETDMRYFCAVSTTARLGFWLFVSGVALGLFLGLRV